MKRILYTVFVAGGTGSRMGAGIPKQFLDLNGIPILQRTMTTFLGAVPDMKVVTVLPRQYFDTWKKLCAVNSFDIPQILVEGGITRFHSVQNALARIPDGAVAAIHDGVRPLVSRGLVARMFAGMQDCRALIPVLPVTDTLKTLDRDASGVLSTADAPEIDRSRIYGAQTPQMFHSEVIKAAYKQPYDVSFTDDASVLRRYGEPLSYIEGERLNIKITTPEDLSLARAVLLLGGTVA